MTATIERTQERTQDSPDQDERARNRFAARRACAAERADVSVQESQALLRAAAESPANQRRAQQNPAASPL